MKTKAVLDEHESRIEQSLEKGEFISVLTPSRKKQLSDAARKTLELREKKEARVNLRLPSSTISGLRAKAKEIGMPYQTLASTVLHQFASGRFTLKIVK